MKNAQGLVSALENEHPGEIAEHPRHGLAGGAGPRGDIAVGRDWLDQRRVVLVFVVRGHAQNFRMNPIDGAQGGERGSINAAAGHELGGGGRSGDHVAGQAAQAATRLHRVA